jgi:hypothetical protein
MNDPPHDGDDRPGGCGEAPGWKAVYRDWATCVHDMVEAWALQRGVDLVVFSTPEVEQDRQRRH